MSISSKLLFIGTFLALLLGFGWLLSLTHIEGSAQFTVTINEGRAVAAVMTAMPDVSPHHREH